MKVVHLTSVHGALDTRIFHKECRSLADAGYRVTLIAPHERDEVVESIQIKAVPIRHHRLARIIHTTIDVLRAALRAGGDLYHFHDPELLPVGLVLRIVGRTVVYDAHEDVRTHIAGKIYLPPLLRRPTAYLVQRLEECICKNLSAVVVVTPHIRDRLQNFNRCVVLVRNFPRLDELGTGYQMDWEHRDESVAYVGGIREDRGIYEMVEAMGLLPQQSAVKLELARSTFPTDIYSRVMHQRGWFKVKDRGPLDRPGIAQLLSRVRAGLVLLHPTPYFMSSLPIKMFEYMAAGIPVIASDFPLWRELIQESGSGIVVDQFDPKAIAEAITYVLSHPKHAQAMGLCGRRAVETAYNWRHEERQLLDLYDCLLVRRAAHGQFPARARL